VSADLTRLVDIVESFPRQTIALLGDFVADEFVCGDISRVSREAPVLILSHRETQILPGGAANAANNLADLGARVLPVSVVGDDSSGRALLDYFRQKGASTSGVLTVPGWTTPTKTRFLAGWTHTVSQQVLRVDRQPTPPLPQRAVRALGERARARVRRASALLISDYGCGVVSPALVHGLKCRLVTLDSRFALPDYRSSRITAATPNEPELEALHHNSIGADTSKLFALGTRTLKQMKLQALLVTRGKDGMVVFERGRPPVSIPVFGSDQAVDVTGAGDTVIAVFTLALAAGATFLEAAHLANYAGGIVVMKRGTSTVNQEELLAALRSEATMPAANPPH